MSDDELTREEREALKALPREKEPGELLEERVVHNLRARGILGRGRRISLVLTPAWVSAAAAALLAIIIGSFSFGQWAGSRQTTEAMMAIQKYDNLRLAAEVQRTGTAYITALNTLVENLEGQDPELQAQGRQVAISALYAAADLVVNIAPDEPVAQNIVWVLDQSQQTSEESESPPPKHYFSF